jgi:hypothetical protein
MPKNAILSHIWKALSHCGFADVLDWNSLIGPPICLLSHVSLLFSHLLALHAADRLNIISSSVSTACYRTASWHAW